MVGGKKVADQFTRGALQTLKGLNNPQYKFAPALAGAGTSGAAVTAGAGAWGAYKDLAAAGAITSEFWLCGLGAYTASGIQVFEVQLYNATQTTTVGNFVLDITATTLNAIPMSIGPFPVHANPSDQIQARAGGAAAKSINCFLWYAVNL
jgi:hypothetical protein